MFQGVTTSRLFRPVAARSTANAIYRALRKRTRMLIYPYRYRFLAQIYALTPHWLWKVLTRIFGVHRAMDTHNGTYDSATRTGASRSPITLPAAPDSRQN
jgi:hypothetical protein